MATKTIKFLDLHFFNNYRYTDAVLAYYATFSNTLFTILSFHQSCIKTKNRNRSMNKVKNLGYDR